MWISIKIQYIDNIKSMHLLKSNDDLHGPVMMTRLTLTKYKHINSHGSTRVTQMNINITT